MRRGVNGVIPFAMELVLLQVGFHCFSYIDERARNGGIQKQFLGVVLFSWQWVAGERVETGGIRHERRGSETLHPRALMSVSCFIYNDETLKRCSCQSLPQHLFQICSCMSKGRETDPITKQPGLRTAPAASGYPP